MNRHVRNLVALLAAASVTVAGCSSGKSGSGSKSTPAPASSAPASTPAGFPASSAPASSASSAETITKAQASAALLTAGDIGPGFSAAQFRSSKDPLPCSPNDPPLEKQVPATLTVGSAFIANSQQAGLSEELRFYADTATAQRVLTLAAKGLDCAQGKMNLTGTPETVTFGKQQDVTSDVGADQAVAVEARSAAYDIALVGCRIGRALVLFSFLRTKTSNVAKLPNPIAVAAKGVAKIKSS